jgi:hypothetical protein
MRVMQPQIEDGSFTVDDQRTKVGSHICVRMWAGD